ncbi:hypothetical protein R2325_16890 [Mycobacteroides chelonae]|uniref:hypothetical protein n=1 Tax=Mycobacteroides chelonae TaxID=1774 RepID=UPI002DE484A0|nr:hypothetical protein [Mycobacteroides chelonae]MEC4871718.1 hypothetical protein [Mycobacteroides chelonae]
MTLAWALLIPGVALGLLAIAFLIVNRFAVRIFDRAVEDCLSMRALAQHSKLMDGVEGAEFGDYRPINLDSDEVLKYATIDLPRAADIEKHWAFEVLRTVRTVEILLAKSDQAFKDAEDALATSSAHRMDRYHRYRDLANGYASDARMVGEHGRLAQIKALEERLACLKAKAHGGPYRIPPGHAIYDDISHLTARISVLASVA